MRSLESHWALWLLAERLNTSFNHDGLETCFLCHDLIAGEVVKHHISYFPEKIVPVHTQCHVEIHTAPAHPLRPPKADIIKFYNDRFVANDFKGQWKANYALDANKKVRPMEWFLELDSRGYLQVERIKPLVEQGFIRPVKR